MRFLSDFYVGLVIIMAIPLGLIAHPSMLQAAEQTLVSKTEQEYLSAKPQWGVELSGSAGGMGRRTVIAAPPGRVDTIGAISAISAQLDFQPAFLQRFGVVSIGPSLNFFPVNNVSGHPKLTLVWAWSTGAQARYQLRLLQEQLLVPMIGYSAEFFNYQLRTGQQQGFLARGPMAGVWLYLGFFDRATAASAFRNVGISKTYITFEGRRLSGWDNNVSVGFNSVHLGLRFEY